VGKEHDVPTLILGSTVDGPETTTLEYRDGTELIVACLSSQHIESVRDRRPTLYQELVDLSMYDLTAPLAEAGARWNGGGSELRQWAEPLVSRITGYPIEMIRRDYDAIGEWLRWRTYVYDQIEADLGHQSIMDEWIRVQACWRRAYPVGVVSHVLVGNIPLANAYSILRSLALKNINIAKSASRDPVTPVAVAGAIAAVMPDHPLAAALTVGYLPRGADALNTLFQASDATCLWGGEDAVAELRRQVPVGCRIVEFGPKWSMSVIDLGSADAESTAWRLATDVTFYDQEACFSPQRCFVVGAADAFIDHLCHYLDVAEGHMPYSWSSLDAAAHRHAVSLTALYGGHELRSGDAWRVIVTDSPEQVGEHPLGRTVFIHPISEPADAARWVDGRTQTISVAPLQLLDDCRDAFAAAGANRFVEVGMSRHPRHGFTHDGLRPSNDLVRMVSIEQGVHDRYKYGESDPAAMESRLFYLSRSDR
jgi:long-chain-fatty-acyl-CoA reductase